MRNLIDIVNGNVPPQRLEEDRKFGFFSQLNKMVTETTWQPKRVREASLKVIGLREADLNEFYDHDGEDGLPERPSHDEQGLHHANEMTRWQTKHGKRHPMVSSHRNAMQAHAQALHEPHPERAKHLSRMAWDLSDMITRPDNPNMVESDDRLQSRGAMLAGLDAQKKKNAEELKKKRDAKEPDPDAKKAVGEKAHPGFKAVAAKIGKDEHVSKDAAGAILASSSRNASKSAKAKNPKLKKVK